MNKPTLGVLLALGLVLIAGPGVAQEKLLIASSLPLTGGSAWYGQQGRQGAEMAVAEANAAGGVLGRQVQVDFWDNACNPAEGVKSITQALASKPYAAVHDGGCSSVALAIMPLIERAGVPYMVASPSATTIAERSGVGGNTWTFKLIPTDAGMLSALVSWIAGKGQADRVAFIGEDTDYGRGGAKAFDGALGIVGKKLIGQEFYQRGMPDYATLISRVKAQKPSLLAAYTIGADGLNFLQQWAESGGGVGLTGRIFTDTIPADILASGVLDGLTTVHPYDIHIDDPTNRDFVARYQARFNAVPNLTAWASYEAVGVILDAARLANSVAPGAIRDSIATGTFKTMFGDPVRFDDHNLAHLPALILGVEKGKVLVLGKNGT